MDVGWAGSAGNLHERLGSQRERQARVAARPKDEGRPQVAFGGGTEQSDSGDEQTHTGFMVVVSASGALFSCGSYADGRLGRPFSLEEEELLENPDAPVHFALPGQVVGDLGGPVDGEPARVKRVAASKSHAAAVTDDGQLLVWD